MSVWSLPQRRGSALRAYHSFLPRSALPNTLVESILVESLKEGYRRRSGRTPNLDSSPIGAGCSQHELKTSPSSALFCPPTYSIFAMMMS
jgi:hypothetical protein